MKEEKNNTKTYKFPEVAVRLVNLPSRQLLEPIDNDKKAADYMRELLSCCTVENLAIVTVDSHIRPINYAVIKQSMPLVE